MNSLKCRFLLATVLVSTLGGGAIAATDATSAIYRTLATAAWGWEKACWRRTAT